MRTEWHATGRLRAAMPPLRSAMESQQVRVGRARGAKYLHAQDARLGLGLGVRRHCAVPAVPRALHGAQLLPEVLALLQVAAPARQGARATQYAMLVPGTAAAAHCPVLIPRPPPTRFLWVLFNSAAASLASRPRAGQPSRTPCARRCARATARNSRHAPPVWARRPPTPKGQVGWFVHKGPFAPFWNCACVL